MIVDDDPEDAFLFCEVLKNIAPDVHCIVAHNCETAKMMVNEASEAPAIIFLDAYMYPTGGKECLLFLNQLERLIDSRIIIHSGALSPAQIAEFKLLGADSVIMKTGSHEALSRTLQAILATDHDTSNKSLRT
jgi:response regulator of citrate/malate metabolism